MLISLATTAQAGQAKAKRPKRRRKQPMVALPDRPILQEDFEQGIAKWQWVRKGGELKWLSEPKQAFKSKGCVMGKVDKKSTHNSLELVLELDKNSMYRVSIWARADRMGKLVLWSQKGKKRRMLGNWTNVGRKWRPYQCQFTMPESGKWTIQIILPSSHGAEPCTMWVDSVRLFETRIPPSTDLTKKKGYFTEPSIAVDGDGAIWTSWLAFEDGCDQLVIGQLVRGDQGFALAKTWRVPVTAKTYALGSELVADKRGAWLVYAGEVDKNWDIYVCRITADGPGKPKRLTKSPAVDAWPAAAMYNNVLWVAWESNRDGRHQVYMSPGDSPLPQRISDAKANSYCPAVAAHDGELCVAWHAYVSGNYDIYGTRLKTDGSTAQILRLTQDGNADRHAQLASASHGLWIAWQRDIQTKAKKQPDTTRMYRPGNVSNRQTWLCRWAAQGLERVTGWEKTILPKGTEMPTLTVDAQNRVWVTARRARGRPGWDSVLQCYAGQWGEAHHLSSQLGWDGRAGIAVTGDEVLVLYQVGKTPSFPKYEAALEEKSDIFLASVSLREAPAVSAVQAEPLTENAEKHWLANLRTQLGEESPRRTITYNGEKLYLYWGDFHEHSSISQCNRWRDISPNDSHDYERDIIQADFTAVTDHGYNFCPGLWHYLSKVVRVNHDPERFVAFLGEEWTSTHERKTEKYPEGFYGHRNLVFSDPYFPRWFNARDETTPRQLWDQLAGMKANFVNIPHQLADTGNVPVDWDFADEVAQPVAEVFQARQSYEYDGCPRQAGRTLRGHFIQDAWARGIVIGVIASPDHGGGQGKAAIYAKELTREAILDAVRARRCYGTSAGRIFLDVRANGHLMGEKVTAKNGGPITVSANALGANDVDRIDLCRNNEFIYSKPGEGREASFTYRDVQPPEGKSYYYVRVQQKDGELAWTSPVWVTRE